MSDFIPRAYQLELYEHAKKQNSILVLGTGSGKTFISILLIKDLGHQIRKSLQENRKWTVFVVNTVPLVYQQGNAIKQHTPYSVGMYEASIGVDYWTKKEWKEQLENHEVLVIVPQIFQDLLNISFFSLERVNLLIFDECHHATGNHPMREIMENYNSGRKNKPVPCVPRIVGLTAAAIHSNCEVEKVEKEVRELEKTLHSTLVTTVDVQAVKEHTTAPKELIVAYDASIPSEYAKIVEEQLTGIIYELQEMQSIDKTHKQPLIRKLTNIGTIMCHLGDWFGALAIKYEMENFEDNDDIPVVSDLKKLLCKRLELIYQYCFVKEMEICNPLNHISEKVQRLLDIICECARDKYGLIFVQTRNTAKLLSKFLETISLKHKDFSFIKSAYVISANAKNAMDINLIQKERKNQQKILQDFARGDVNFLISTNILEEGVDVRKCNIVIRFDEPSNFCSYVQSRGRARAGRSKYILMVESKSVNTCLSHVATYRRIEEELSRISHNRLLPTDHEISSHFAEDEVVPPYEPHGPSGPRITFTSAVPLINRYCGTLPHDKFTVLTPAIEYEEEEEYKMVRAKIKLPINARLKTFVCGDWMSSKVHAKKSAAMALCKELHKLGELNDHLLPVQKLDDIELDDQINILPEVSIDGMPEPGTKKRRQIYRKEMCQALSPMSGNFRLYSVIVQSKGLLSNEIPIDSKSKNMSIGLLCKQDLTSPPFSLYSSKWNEVVVDIKLIEHVPLSHEIVSHIQHFHKVVFENLLNINRSLFDYISDQTSLFILPMNGNSIDTSLLQHIASLDSLRIHHEEHSNVDVFKFERSVFEGSIIYPLYKPMSEGMFYVTEIHDDMNPLNAFPQSSKMFDSYEQYFVSEYGRKISNKDQPLITAKHLPKDLNFLRKQSQQQVKKKSRTNAPKYIPELCGVLPLRASLWWQIMLLPSVLHRLNSLLVADELRKMAFQYSIHKRKCHAFSSIDFDWSENFTKEIVQSSRSNLCVLLAHSEPQAIHSFMMLNAITLLGANDNFNAERLEVLGDSFLKFIVSEYLFMKYSDDHEGKLSQKRSKLVCNKTLYSLAKNKHIPEKIQSTILNAVSNGIMPGFVLKPEEEKKLREISAPHGLWARFGTTTEEEFIEEVRREKEEGRVKASCYNPWTEHELGDKSVADCVEALLGVCLLVGGSETAITFLHNLGINVLNDASLLSKELLVKSALLNEEGEAKRELQRLYDKSCLDTLEKKIQYSFNDKSFLVQAVTHSSYTMNRVTDCYQRLEFLGDAVLDYLITGLIFSSDSSYTPGQLSDLRSYYVKNETLAKVSAKYDLQGHLLNLAPELQASIDKYLNCVKDESVTDEDLYTESDEVELQDIDVPKALGDLVEALIGAVYLDSGRSLQETWDVVTNLMGDIIQQTKTDIPINCIRKLYEKAPGVKFVKRPLDDNNTMAGYEVTCLGLPPVIGHGKNYKSAKAAAAKKGLRMLKKKEKEEASKLCCKDC